jgi:hypothetical protein
VKNLMQTHIVAIAVPQTSEDNGRYHNEYPESDEGFMNPLNHSLGLERGGTWLRSKTG